MSKPVSNTDVEDVLSSIRRLVSDNKGQGVSSSTPDAADRLVLSPQQRVPENDVLRLQPHDAVHLPDADRDESKDDRNAAPSLSDMAASDDGSKHSEADEGQEPVPSSQTRSGRSLGVNELTAKIAALETAIAKTSDQWEPDGISKDDYAGTEASGMAWPDTADLDATTTPVETPEGEADAPVEQAAPTPVSPIDDQILDEEALRDLVSDIVRSELQGALGERITRNVRKLVRREIHRALAARDLD